MAGREFRLGAQLTGALGTYAADVESDEELLARLRAGDEGAFVSLVGRYNGSLLRLARAYVPNDDVAEEARALTADDISSLESELANRIAGETIAVN